jgi:hypothetical protein
MALESPPEHLLGEIDAVHVRVREAFRRRDLSAYMATFALDLTYRQADGRLVSREEVARSIAHQFARLVAFDSGFDREAASATGADLTESGTQTASIALRVFAVFAVRWKVERRGQYTWARVGPNWLLRNVRIDQERVTRAGFGLASRLGAGSP